MVKYFKEVVGAEGQVHVSNSDNLSVAFCYADNSVVTPLIYDDAYIPFLLEYCKNYRIDILIPLFDIDLLVLANNKDLFFKIGTKVIVSDVELVSICNDKWKTFLFLKENGFNVPDTYLSLQEVLASIEKGKISYPIIVKPRFGMGSIALSIAENEMALRYYYQKNTQLIRDSYLKYESSSVDTDQQILYQEFLDGQEYGADIINDLTGNCRNIIIKKKIAMRAGETDIAEIIDEPAFKTELNRLSSLTRHIGNLDVDLFLSDGCLYVLEMNARFGGGYPFSHLGGCNLPKAIVKWIKGEEIADSMLCAQIGIIGYKELSMVSASRKP